MTKTVKTSTSCAPRLEASHVAQHLALAWSLYSDSADGGDARDPAIHRQADKMIETLERLLIQIPARDPAGAIAQLAVIKQELDTLSGAGADWVPPDWETVAEVVGVAAVVLAKALGISDTPVLRNYCWICEQGSPYPVTLHRVAQAVGA